MLSDDWLVDEFEAMDLSRSCLSDAKPKKGYPNMPKTWSEPLVDYEALAGEAINIGDKWDYADLLVQVGIIKEKEKETLSSTSTFADRSL